MPKRRSMAAPAWTPDGNASTYDPDQDGRSSGVQRIQYVPLSRIRSATHQTRLVQDPDADEALAQDIDLNGITHPPLLRPHPTIAGDYETVAGHRRVWAMDRLAKSGRGRAVLRPCAEGFAAPCLVEDLDDARARAATIGENLLRRDLSAWEQVLALGSYRDHLAAEGARSSVRGVAGTLRLPRSTIEPYLQVAGRLTDAILAEAGLLVDLAPGAESQADHGLLAKLSLDALRRVASAPAEERAARLRSELGLAPLTEAESLPQKTDPAFQAVRTPTFQVNIRGAIADLPRTRARAHLDRILSVVPALMRSAGPAPSVRRMSEDGREVVIIALAPDGRDWDATAAVAALAELDTLREALTARLPQPGRPVGA